MCAPLPHFLPQCQPLRPTKLHHLVINILGKRGASGNNYSIMYECKCTLPPHKNTHICTRAYTSLWSTLPLFQDQITFIHLIQLEWKQWMCWLAHKRSVSAVMGVLVQKSNAEHHGFRSSCKLIGFVCERASSFITLKHQKIKKKVSALRGQHGAFTQTVYFKYQCKHCDEVIELKSPLKVSRDNILHACSS